MFADAVYPPAKSVARPSQVWLGEVIASNRFWIPERQVLELLSVTGNPLPIALFRVNDGSQAHFLHLLDGFGNADERLLLRGWIGRLQPQARGQLIARARLDIDREETEMSRFEQTVVDVFCRRQMKQFGYRSTRPSALLSAW